MSSKHCIAVDLLLKHNQQGSMLGRFRYIIYSTNMIRLRHTKRCHGCLQYDRKFEIFIFLIGYINVNKGVFCLIITYLRIKSYNVLNYNNCSTDWSFPLMIIFICTCHYDLNLTVTCTWENLLKWKLLTALH